MATVRHDATEEERAIRGRAWRGGLLAGGSVPSPCDPHPVQKLAVRPSPSPSLPPGEVLVRVLDDAGLQVPGVQVKLGPESTSAPTDDNGEVRFGPLPPGSYNLTARRAGFAAINGTFELGESGVEVEVVLESEIWF